MNTPIFALLGNPNCGKTTLFNALTGSRQHTGNWPGVTVERKEGRFDHAGQTYQVIDLPGTYALDDTALSEDERIARHFVLSGEAQLIVLVIDAANLERGLYLATQVAEVGLPMLLVLNRMDVAYARGHEIDTEILAERYGCPVLTTVGHRLHGTEALKAAMVAQQSESLTREHRVVYAEPVERALDELAEDAAGNSQTQNWPRPRWLALEALQGREDWTATLGATTVEQAVRLRETIEAETGEDVDILIADGRYAAARELACTALHTSDATASTWSDRIDSVMLHRWFGVPIFLGVMYLLFLFSINFADVLIAPFETLSGAIFVHEFGQLITGLGGPDWLRLILADGIGGGIQVVATFIPIVGFLYLFLSLLEDSGYMARAAFVMDRFMRALGLPGKAFVPLVVGFGCNVPAIMAARTLDNPRERIITALMAPFMSCGARLAVYALFVSAFFPAHGTNLVFLLYLIGVAAAMLTAMLLKGTMLPGESQPFLMELPSYQVPTLRGVGLRTWDRLRGFVIGAGQIIVLMVLILNVMSTVSLDGRMGNTVASDESVLADVGRSVTPALAPMGIEADNWPATVGLLTGILAKEVVVGTLDTLYGRLAAREEGGSPAATVEPWQQVASAFAAIPAGLAETARNLGDPLGLRVLRSQEPASELEVSAGTFGEMAARFNGGVGAFAYLLFVLLYFPCASATAALAREIGPRWAMFSVVWSTSLAFGLATIFYQLATIMQHPYTSLAWVIGLLLLLAAAVAWLRYKARNDRSDKGSGLPGYSKLAVDSQAACRHCG